MQIRLRIGLSRSAGPLAVIAFRLIFAGAGCFALGYAYVQYRQGASWEAVAVVGGVGAVFVVLSLFRMLRAWRRQGARPAPQKPEEAPWHVRPEWRRAELVESRGPSGRERAFALLWNAVAWPVAALLIHQEMQRPDPDWAVLLVLLFPLGGLALAWGLVRHALHRRKFGTTSLVMEAMPARLGEPIRLRLKAGIRPADAPEEGFRVRLSCYRRYVHYTRDSDGNRTRRVERDLLWRDEKRVRGRAYGRGDRMEVPVSFQAPAKAPPSTPHKRENRILWEVDVEADLPGLDFQTTFEIPVFPPEQEADASDEELDWAGRGDAERVRPAGDAAPAGISSYAAYAADTTFTAPEGKGVAVERTPRGGLRVRFSAGRNKGATALFAAIALATGAGGLFALPETFFGALVCFLFAGLSGYGAWTLWTTASTLTVEDGTVTLVRGPFGRGTPVVFACDDLADVSVEPSGHAGSKTYYNLVLHRREEESRRRAAASEAAAERVVRFAEGAGLVRGAAADRAKVQIGQNLRARHTRLTVARGLTDKPEADWIAAIIQQAARRDEARL